ncbi:MAG: tRNA lysidine(34) synthetase TilS [Clostridiales bacterium]|nr:tRNA lysidine(34) synthetase TilS [Clostridiales bacterium]
MARPSVYIKLKLPKRLIIGLSGGADSVALAHLLLEQREAQGLELSAVHVNHGLRGEASDDDEAFVRDLCARWDLPLDVYRAQPPEHPGEDWARQTRYAFYRQAVAQRQADAVALAHHRDDQAETLLLHLLRGAGLTGLTGMPEDGEVLGVRVIRPLLGCSRRQLREILAQAGLAWREDESNQDTRYLRNALRHELLPLMERLAPGAAQRMAATAELLGEENAVLEQLARRALNDGEAWLPLDTLKDVPPGLRPRMLRIWWQRYAGDAMQERGLSRRQTEQLAQLVEAPVGSRCNLPGGCHGYRGWTHLHLLGRETTKPGVTLQILEGAEGPGDGKTSQAMPGELLEGCVVRTRQPGDWIRPYGQAGRQSLQDYMTNKRVDAPFRDAVPLLCRGNEVLLAAGIGAGAVPPFAPANENKTAYWIGVMPWMKQ